MSPRQPITPPTLRGVLITTKFHGPTNYTGARFSASCKWHDTIHRVYVSQDYKLDSEQNHLAAAQKLVDNKLNTPKDLNPSQGVWRITANAFNDPDCNHWLVCKDWWIKESIQQLAGFHQQLEEVQACPVLLPAVQA